MNPTQAGSFTTPVSNALKATIQHHDSAVIIHARGEIDAANEHLSAVTHLGSAGVGALAAACDRARKQGTECVLVAPPGSPAHHVLSLVQLPVVGADTEDIFAQE